MMRPSVARAGDGERYSASPEYRAVLEELRNPAPSPARIATGKLPTVDNALKPEVVDDTTSVRLVTSSSELTLDKASAVLSWRSRKTGGTWKLGGGLACESPGAARVKSVARRANTWAVVVASGCGETTLTLELLTNDLMRLTYDDSGAGKSSAIAMNVQTSGPAFGLGERFAKAGLGGTQLEVRPQDRYGEAGHAWVYVAVPLLYDASGLGLYADTAFATHVRFDDLGSTFAMRIAGHPASVYLFATPDPKGVLAAYTTLTGRQPSPPWWTYGPWLTAVQGKGAVLDEASRIRAEGIPASALWVFDQMDEANNLGWPFWFGSYYGDPRAFTDTLHAQGFRVLTYVHPYVRARMLPYTNPSPQYDKAVKEKFLVTGADGLPAGPRFEEVPTGNVDFTNPRAVDWWQAMITSAVRDQGFDGWMEDFGEWIRDTDVLAAGKGTVLSMLYPLLYHKVTLRAARAAKPDVVPFVRSGCAGSQQYTGVLWGGDQWPNWSHDYGLPSVITAGITAGMSGFSTWGPDIHSAGSSKELWMRWVQFGALTPVMRDHVWQKPDRTFNVFTDAETIAHFRKYAMLHSALLPYFVTYADEAARTGVPIMRHTLLEFPADPRSAGAEHQYFLGRELLVAPVIEPGATERRLYAPAGEWVGYWSGEQVSGGRDVSIGAPLEQIPMLVRAGSILPFKPESEAATWSWSDPHLLETSLVWKAYLSATGNAHGRFALPNGTSAELEQRDQRLTIVGKSRWNRAYEIVFRATAAPKSVRLNGASPQWWWNPSSAETHIVFHASDFTLEVDGVAATFYEH